MWKCQITILLAILYIFICLRRKSYQIRADKSIVLIYSKRGETSDTAPSLALTQGVECWDALAAESDPSISQNKSFCNSTTRCIC